MNQQQDRYRFATADQWKQCIFAQADLQWNRVKREMSIRPIVPYSKTGRHYPDQDPGQASLPAVTHCGDVLWVENGCTICRLYSHETEPQRFPAHPEFAQAKRLLATEKDLWANVTQKNDEILFRFDADSMTQTLQVKVPEHVDIAHGGDESILVLRNTDHGCCILRYDRSGHILETKDLQDVTEAKAFVNFPKLKRMVILAGEEHPHLYWFGAGKDKSFYNVSIAGLRPCFDGEILGSDPSGRVFLIGQEHTAGPAANPVEKKTAYAAISFDADGNRLDDLLLDPDDAPFRGLTASRHALYIAGKQGLRKYEKVERLPMDFAPVKCELLTPRLTAFDRSDRRFWLRAEVLAKLPPGTSLELTWYATDDQRIADSLTAKLENAELPFVHRLAYLADDLVLKTGSLTIQGANAGEFNQPYAAKLFEIKALYLWIRVSLTASAGSMLPRLAELNVLYPGRTLLENLPSYFQAQAEQPGDFLRNLVGVLETSTQDLDKRISSLGQRIHPSTANEDWLDFVADWLGVPWDEALSLEQKRAIVKASEKLIAHRGTRVGLEELLQCLIPNTPHAYRIIDFAADYGYAILGGGTSPGMKLPALLAGGDQRRPELNLNAYLGQIHLPCEVQAQKAQQAVGKIRIDVAAKSKQRQAWEPWLLNVLSEMLPLTTRVELRWVPYGSLIPKLLSETLTMQSIPEANLGGDSIIGQSRLPPGEQILSSTGPVIGNKLR